MSTEESSPDGEASAPRRSLPLVPIIAVVLALAAGGAAGYLAAGPMLVKRAFAGGLPTLAAAAPAGDNHADAHAAPAEPGPQYLIENVIVNPAGSQGTRFVLLTIAIEARDTAAVALMKQRDAEIRDAVIGLLGSESVESLSDIGRRDQLKDAIRTRVVALLPDGSVGKLYVPQFVLQ